MERRAPFHEEAEKDPMGGSAVTRRGGKLLEELWPGVALLSRALRTWFCGSVPPAYPSQSQAST